MSLSLADIGNAECAECQHAFIDHAMKQGKCYIWGCKCKRHTFATIKDRIANLVSKIATLDKEQARFRYVQFVKGKGWIPITKWTRIKNDSSS